jgi:hypothetical protein
MPALLLISLCPLFPLFSLSLTLRATPLLQDHYQLGLNAPEKDNLLKLNGFLSSVPAEQVPLSLLPFINLQRQDRELLSI